MDAKEARARLKENLAGLNKTVGHQWENKTDWAMTFFERLDKALENNECMFYIPSVLMTQNIVQFLTVKGYVVNHRSGMRNDNWYEISF